MQSTLVGGLMGCVAAIIGSVIAVVIFTRDFETIGFALLAGLVAFPAIIVFILLSSYVSSNVIPHIAFWVISGGLGVYFFVLYRQSLLRAIDDGSGLMALNMVFALCGASILSYLVLFFKFKQ